LHFCRGQLGHARYNAEWAYEDMAWNERFEVDEGVGEWSHVEDLRSDNELGEVDCLLQSERHAR